MIPKFNDENYDGIVLNIPTWFININNLGELLDNLRVGLEEHSKLSTFLPDHLNNLHELENYKDKSKFVKEKREIANTRKSEIEINFNKLISGDVVNLAWDTRKDIFDSTLDLELGGKTYKFYDIFTNKLNIKTSFKKDFENEIDTFEKFKYFCKQFDYIKFLLYNAPPEFVDWKNVNFSVQTYAGNLQMNVKFLVAKEVTNNTLNSYRYTKSLLMVNDETKELYTDRVNYTQYVKHNMKLKKQ